MYHLIEKGNFKKIQLLKFLEASVQQTSTHEEINKHLGYSEYVLHKCILELQNDCERFNQEEPHFSITLVDKSITLNIKTDHDYIGYLTWQYLTESPKFQLLDQLFRHDSFSLTTFKNKFYLSQTKAHSLKVDITNYLKKVHIRVGNNYQLVSSEERIRLFFFQLYFYGYNSYEFPFSEEITVMSKLAVTTLIEETDFSFTEIEQLKLRYLFAVCLERLDRGFVLDAPKNSLTDFEDEKSQQFIQSLSAFFEEYTSLSKQGIRAEVSFILHFLISEKIILLEDPEEFQFPTIVTNMTQEFIDEFNTFFPYSLNSVDFLKELKLELNYIHYHLYFYQLDIQEKSPFSKQTVLQESYPEFYEFCHFLFDKMMNKYETIAIDTFGNRLIYNYLFVLIKFIPVEEITRPICVTVDFSYGKNYNEFIKQNIDGLPFSNLVINSKLNEQTDIYLSDIQPLNYDPLYLIWHAPPLASDWESFGNLVIYQRNTKTLGGKNNDKIYAAQL